MSFIPKKDARTYVAQEGDTLQAIAARETAAGNPITWQELARYNWGTDDPDEVQAFMRDILGCRHRGADKQFVISAEDVPQIALLIPDPMEPVRLTQGGQYTLRVRTRRTPGQMLGQCSLPGITFGFNSSFIRPNVVEHLEVLEALVRQYPDAKIMIFGHTDAVGGDLYNKKLSERRAWSVHAFVTNDPAAWETLYNHPDEDWGLAVIQEILADLGHDPGPLDGDWGPQTRAAMRRFLGLPDEAPVQNDAAFREQLFAAYMADKHDVQVGPEQFMEPGYMGCGEFNRVEGAEDETEANRRVTFFFFHPERLPNLPCAFAACGPCQQQMVSLAHRYTPTFRCSFYDSLAHSSPAVEVALVRVRLFDPYHQPLPHAPCVLQIGEDTYELSSDAEGYVETKVLGIPDRGVIRWGILEPEEEEDMLDEGEEDGFAFELAVAFDYHQHDDAHEQAKWRLHHLGYPLLHDEPLEDQQAVLFAFQQDHQATHGLALTGELDEATRAALFAMHDACDPVDIW